MSATVVKPKIGRPKSPRDLAEARELARIAGLAGSVLSSLRRPGRGMYDSERELRRFLDEDGIAYSASDLAPALGLLAECGKIGRSAPKSNQPRSGWLLLVNGNGATTENPSEGGTGGQKDEPAEVVESAVTPVEAADEPAVELTDEQRITALAESIDKAMLAGNGRSARCETVAELVMRLDLDGVSYDPADIPFVRRVPRFF